MALARCQTCGRRFASPHEGCEPRAAATARRVELELPGSFTAVRLLGEGGYGTVWLARATHALVAVKLAPPGVAAERLGREGEVLASLPSGLGPAFVAQGVLADGGAWLAMEPLDGHPLSDRLEQRAVGVEPEALRRLAPALLDLVGGVHAAGWLHLDLKPDNVLERADGALRLIDFGTAQRPGDPAEGAGTADYLSPEQLDGQPATWASDLYSLGVMLFELATGRTPFFGARADLAHGHRAMRPPRPSELEPTAAWLDALVDAALRKRPDERPPNLAEARALLDTPSHAATRTAPVRLATSTGERRTVGVVFFETPATTEQVRALATELHAELAVSAAPRYALAFDDGHSSNLALRSLSGARVATSRGLASRARVDVLTLTVQRGADGARRYVGAALMKKTAWPAIDAPAISLSDEVNRLVGSGEAITPTPPTDQPAPFFGHHALLARLTQLAAEARGRRSIVARVVGEPGVGKTRLSRELQSLLTSAGLSPLTLKAHEVTPGIQHDLLGELLMAANGGRPHTPDEARALLERRLGPGFEPAWAALQLAQGWLPAEARDAYVTSVPPAALRASTTQAFGEFVRDRAERGGVALVLDDAHLADDRVLDAVEYATLVELQLLVVALGRPSLVTARPALGRRAGRFEAFELGPLDAQSAAALCRRLLLPARQVSDAVVQRLTERAAATPQLLTELVLGLKQQGLLAPRASGDGFVVVSEAIDRLPNMPLLEWTARRELAGLGPELRGHARLAAVVNVATLGQHVAAANALDDAGHRPLVPLDPRTALERLGEREVLQVDRAGRWRFRKPVVRDLLMSEGSPTELTAMHGAALVAFERDPALIGRQRAARLALHADGAGVAGRAVTWWLEAGLSSADAHLYVDADQALTRALALLPAGDEQRLTALRSRGLVRYRLARYGDARVDFEIAHREAQGRGAKAIELDVLLRWSTALDWMSDFGAARDKVRLARQMYDASAEPALLPLLLYAEGRSECRFENFRAAGATLRSALALPQIQAPTNEETRIEALVLLLYILPLENRLEEADALFAELRERCERVGDRFHLGAALLNSRSLWLARGQLEKGLATQEEAAAIARELGELLLEYVARGNVAELLLMSDEAQRAEAAAREAIEIEGRSKEVTSGPWARLIRARACVAAGRVTEAAEEVSRIDALLAGGTDQGLLPHEVLMLEAVKAAVRGAAREDFERLLSAARTSEVWDEYLEIATLWLVAHPGDAVLVKAELPEQVTARVPRALARRLA